ncbi:MAG: hypothetical protein KDA41_12325, partial [Planctomycetales bacterium]|nr:hypothetical protein [Planctomycetales bacterium]
MRIGQHISLLTSASFRFGAAGRDASTSGLAQGFGRGGAGGPTSSLAVQRLKPVVSTGGPGAASAAPDAEASDSAARFTLARISQLVEGIRDIVAQPGSDQDELRQASIDAALIEIGYLSGEEVRLGGPAYAKADGLRAAEVASADIVSFARDQEFVIAAEVTQAADAARLSLVGASSTIDIGATFELIGPSGRASLRVEQAESLDTVARRINDHSSTIGAYARVDGDQVIVESLTVGSGAAVQVRQLADTDYVASGVNSAQLANFEVVSLTTGAVETVAGNVTTAAEHALVRYVGTAEGNVAGTADIRITGALGAVDVSLVEGESLADVASRVNDATGTTGVVAVVAGNDLELQSVDVGSSAEVHVEALSLAATVEATGVNAGQIADFNVVSIEDGATETLSGQVLTQATGAELTLRIADGGLAANDSTFEITGDLGSATISAT